MSLEQQPTSLDSRYLFGGYAIVTGALGIAASAYGLQQHNSMVRIAGVALIAAACFSVPVSRIVDPEARRRAAGWYALAHAAIALLMDSPFRALRPAVPGFWPVNLLLCLIVLFFVFWMSPDGSRWGGSRARSIDAGLGIWTGEAAGEESTEKLRSRYELQIREAAGQEERKRLARDLHDSVKQQLFVIQTAAATAEARFREDASGAMEALGHVRGAAREAIAEMQAMLDSLQAAPLENVGLAEALKKQCEALQYRTGAKVHLEIGEMPHEALTQPGCQQAIFRVAQEALANIARHARASNVWVTLQARTGRWELEIRDDGAGFDPNVVGGMGLANMRARAEEFGGIFVVVSAPGNGTSIRFTVRYLHVENEPYGRRAFYWGLAVAALLIVTIIAAIQGRPLYYSITLAASGLAFARDFAAYRRVRKLRAQGAFGAAR